MAETATRTRTELLDAANIYRQRYEDAEAHAAEAEVRTRSVGNRCAS